MVLESDADMSYGKLINSERYTKARKTTGSKQTAKSITENPNKSQFLKQSLVNEKSKQVISRRINRRHL